MTGSGLQEPGGVRLGAIATGQATVNQAGRDLHVHLGRGVALGAGATSGADGAGLRVFVSHTSELREFPAGGSYVDAVERAISACGHVIVDMADFPAADLPPAELCAERVASCDVYLGVLGTRYGSLVRDRPELSYTELEFEAATQAGLERLVFVLDITAADVGIPLQLLLDLEYGARQQAFGHRAQESGLVTQKFASPAALGQLVERSLVELTERRRLASLVSEVEVEVDAPVEPPDDSSSQLQAYLTSLAESYQWLELQGIREAGSLRIELEKVYVALKAEPETEYDLRHLANLHSLEVREAAGGTSLDLIEPSELAMLDAENVRRTYQPRRDEARRAGVTDVQTIADAFRVHHRMVLLGGPGSGKTTLGHWLALQLARGLLQQLPRQVAPENSPIGPNSVRIHVPAGASWSFSEGHFAPLLPAGKLSEITIDALPARGALALFGSAVTAGQVVRADQIERLAFTPVGNECGTRYAQLQFTATGEWASAVSCAIAMDVGIHVQVPVSQVNPDYHRSDGPERFVDLGPARVPVFLRLAHFARELAERERGQKPTLSLEEYLGRDPDSCGRPDDCDPESRNALLRQYLDDGQAVVILDGLDELPEANRRTVSLKIQDFIEKFTDLTAADESRVPSLAGGNQVIVSSRYVGYKLMPIRSGCVHFGIQAMQRPAVEHFARAWVAAINAELGADFPGRLAANALISEIYDDSRPAIRELATNPLLITILATVYWADGRLPDRRAGVYDRVVENLLRIWLNRPECQALSLQREVLLAALEPLAAEMQGDRASNGLISLDRIGELIEKPVALMLGSSPGDRSFRPVLDALLTAIRKHVGLLAEQSAGNYAFFHRTFQEFLAARYLLSDREHAAELLVERLDDPQWREPLLLALGLAMISPEWGPRTRTKLLEDVLAGDDRDPLIPRASMLLVSALPDLKNVPRQVVGKVVKQLLTCYAFSQDQSQAEGLRAGICDVFEQLRRGPQADLTSEVISDMIRQPRTDQDYSAAAAEVLLRIGWFTTETVDALLRVADRDQAVLRWPVRWALLAALGQPADSLVSPQQAPMLNTSRLLATHLPMRRLLESSPELTAFVRGDVGWLWLIVALYGGLGHVQVRERLRAHQHQRLLELQSVADVEEETTGPPSIPPIEFCPGDIVHDLADAELSRTIQRHLRLQRPSGELADAFRRIWDRGADPAASAEAIVGLAALGQDVVPLVRAALTERDRQPAAQAALSRFRWLRSLLREPLLRSGETAARTIPEVAPEEHQLDLLRIAIEGRSVSGGGPLPVSDVIASCRLIEATSDSVRDALEAERLAYVFSGLSGGDSDTVSAALASAADADPGSPAPVARGWPALSQARNLLARPRLPWPQMPLAPRCETAVERYLAMLDGLAGSPSEYDYLAGYLLGQCRPLLTEHPSLVWETLAICWYRGEGFMGGYLAGASGNRAAALASNSVAVEFAAVWDDHRSAQRPAEDLLNDLEKILARRAESIDEVGDSIVESGLSILQEASLIGDPYLRFRALWRLVGIISSSLEIPLGLDVLGLVETITEPHDQARAFEWIMMTIPDKQLGLRVSTSFLDRAARTLSRISDPDNRARAQCRLAFLAPERLDDLITIALESVDQIVEPQQKAETIIDIRSALSGLSSLEQGLDRLADALPEPWLRDKAQGRTSRLISAYRLDYGLGALAWRLPPEAAAHAGAGADRHRLRYPNGHLAWGMLYLNAVAAEVGVFEATATGSNADWELLLSPDWQTGVDGLIESAADGGLRVSAREASVLNRVVQSGRAEILASLWSYLESPDPGATAMISRWTEGDAQTERWKALVQAEAGQLTAENVDLIIELLVGRSDRLRLRASLALHGRTPNTANRNRRWSTRRVPVEAVETIASHASRIDHQPSVRSSLHWVQHDIHHDNAEALEHWLTEATATADAPANWILEYMESIDDALVARFLESIPSAPPRLQRTQLIGLARLAHCSKALDGVRTDVLAAAAGIPRAIRRKVCVALEGPVSYLKAAAQAAAAFDEGSRLDAARWMIEESMLWLDDDCLTDERACLRRLKLIGDGFYVHAYRGGYWDQADETAAELAENEDALRLLLSWVESLSPAESSRTRFGDILTAVEALARVSPNAFAALADPDVWEPMLTEWAETAERWTARLAAVRLLSLLRRVTEHVAVALRTAMSDVSFVQQAAYSAVGEFRRTKGDIIPELLGPLDDPSAAVAASTTRLLVSLARGEGETADRRRILRGLRDAVTRAAEAGAVYLMNDDEGTGEMTIQFVDRLDRILYRAIFEVSGL